MGIHNHGVCFCRYVSPLIIRRHADERIVCRTTSRYLESIKFGSKARFRPQLRISGDRLPTVDVLIFYCGEELNILLDTVRAACSVDYPRHKFRVVVLDDSDSVSKHIEALKVEFANLLYSTRETRDKTWHKAGNINHGLSYVALLPGGPNELVAGLDVDMLPEKDWLRRLAPHLIRDEKFGLVSPNQRFYNVPYGDPLGQLLQYDHMNNVRQMRRDFGNVGLGAGSGWLARRSALDSIGGFAVDGTSEDFLTCIDLRQAGWTVAVVDENLQWGMVPDSFNGHTKQHQRWYTAALTLHKALSGSIRPQIPFTVRILAETSTISYMIAMFLCYIGMPLMVMSGRPIVRFTHEDHLKTLIRLSCADFAVQSLHGFLESWVADFNIYCWHELSYLWHVPLFIPPLLHHWIPYSANFYLGRLTLLQPANSGINKSSEDQHRSRWKRVKTLLLESHMLTHVLVLSVCIAGLVTFLHNIRSHPGGLRQTFQWVVTHAGWPPVLFFWTSALRNALKPFYYALFVPPRPERESYLVRDEKSHVAYPTAEAKDQKHRQVKEWHLGLIIVYYSLVVIGSWWL